MEKEQSKIACRNCVFWNLQNYPGRGECRNHSPVYLILSTRQEYDPRGQWPTTLGDDYCGDWIFNNKEKAWKLGEHNTEGKVSSNAK